MQVLGQDVEAGDVIRFPRGNRLTNPYWDKVASVAGNRAYNQRGAHRVLPYDMHVTVLKKVPREEF